MRLEIAMHDFAARVGESVRAAREARRQQRETLRREWEGAPRKRRVLGMVIRPTASRKPAADLSWG